MCNEILLCALHQAPEKSGYKMHYTLMVFWFVTPCGPTFRRNMFNLSLGPDGNSLFFRTFRVYL